MHLNMHSKSLKYALKSKICKNMHSKLFQILPNFSQFLQNFNVPEWGTIKKYLEVSDVSECAMKRRLMSKIQKTIKKLNCDN